MTRGGCCCCCCCCCYVASVVSDSLPPQRRQPTSLPCPWDSPSKNTGVGCHFLLQCMKVKCESEAAQSCLTLSDPMDCSLPGSSVHGIFQARVLEWGAIAFSGLEVECRRKRCQRSWALSLIRMGKMKKKQVWGYQESSFRHVKFERSIRLSTRLIE